MQLLLQGLYQSFGICGSLTRAPAPTSHSYRFTDDVIARRDGHDASRSTVLSFGRTPDRFPWFDERRAVASRCATSVARSIRRQRQEISYHGRITLGP